jgi:hypothetical protein
VGLRLLHKIMVYKLFHNVDIVAFIINSRPGKRFRLNCSTFHTESKSSRLTTRNRSLRTVAWNYPSNLIHDRKLRTTNMKNFSDMEPLQCGSLLNRIRNLKPANILSLHYRYSSTLKRSRLSGAIETGLNIGLYLELVAALNISSHRPTDNIEMISYSLDILNIRRSECR